MRRSSSPSLGVRVPPPVSHVIPIVNKQYASANGPLLLSFSWGKRPSPVSPRPGTPTIDREDASSMVTAGATADTTEGNSRASRESGLLCSHSHGESIATPRSGTGVNLRPKRLGLGRPSPVTGAGITVHTNPCERLSVRVAVARVARRQCCAYAVCVCHCL